MACEEVDWGPPIIIDGELPPSRYYGNFHFSNWERPISGDDMRVLRATKREIIGTTVQVDDSDASTIVALANLCFGSDYFDHYYYYTTAQSHDDASMLLATVHHHELRPPADPPPIRMVFG